MWVEIDRGWSALEGRLKELAESGSGGDMVHRKDDHVLFQLGLIDLEELTTLGRTYHMAKFVVQDDDQAREILGEILKQQEEINTFCGALWGHGKITKPGALSLLKTLARGAADDEQATRYLELMNRARLISYNRNSPSVEVLYNPNELAAPDERERLRGHVISPDTPFSNLLAVKQLLRSARKQLRWYEQHMDAKVLELLHSEVLAGQLKEVRLLSGPNHITEKAKSEFARFKKELASTRKIHTEWRLLDKSRAQKIHGRFFISEGISRHLPPLNLILQGTRDEILPSDTDAAEFDGWWKEGSPIESYLPPSS